MSEDEHLDDLRVSTLTDAENMIYCTVKITAFRGTQKLGTGTGFLYRINLKNGLVEPLLITNEHVVDGADNIVINFHLASIDTQYVPVQKFAEITYQLGNAVFTHPDQSIDLCAIPIGCIEEPLATQVESGGYSPFLVYFTRANIPNSHDWDSFSAIESLKMVGYPDGLSDTRHNLPIVRQGISATQMSVPFKDQPEFLVDMACFPGSSGSPIFVHNEGTFFDRKANAIRFGTRLFLVGILHAGPSINNHGKIEFGFAGEFSFKTMMHLGMAIRADQLLDFDHYYENEYPKQFRQT